MTVPKCTSIWGHKFEARFSTSTPIHAADMIRELRTDENEGEVRCKIYMDRHYEADICVRCGHVVEHKTPAKSTD